jgi:hypothetical protein
MATTNGDIKDIQQHVEAVRNQQTVVYQNQDPSMKYLIFRYLEIICVGAFIFGFLWNGTEVLNLTTPQFLMLYGGTGAVVCEILARVFSKKK